MNNNELVNLYQTIRQCLGAFHNTRFCLALSHNRRILDPIIDSINGALNDCKPDTEEFKKAIQEYKEASDAILQAFAMKDDNGQPSKTPSGEYKIRPDEAKKVQSDMDGLFLKSPAIVTDYLNKIDEIRSAPYDAEIKWYTIKQEHLPEGLGRNTDILFPLIEGEVT